MIADQALLPPILGYLSFNAQADDTIDFSLDDSYTLEDTFSWFVPDKKGRHDLKTGVRWSHVWISNPNNSNANGTFSFNSDRAFNAADPSTYPERFSIRAPGPLDYELRSNVWELYAQDKWAMTNGLTLSLGIRYDLEIIPIDETDNPLFSDPGKYPVDKNNVAPRLGVVWNPDQRGKSVIRAGYGTVLRPDAARDRRQFPVRYQVFQNVHRQFPAECGRPGSFKRPAADRSAAGARDESGPGDSGDARVFECAPSAGDGESKRRNGDVGRSRSQATVPPPNYCGVRARAVSRSRGVSGLRPDAGSGHVSESESEYRHEAQHEPHRAG